MHRAALLPSSQQLARNTLISRLAKQLSTKHVAGPLNYINGQRSSPSTGVEIPNMNPATGQVICSFVETGSADVDSAVNAAKNAFDSWSSLSGTERSRVLMKTSLIMRDRLDDIAELECLDTGKPLWEAKFDIGACADAFEYFSGLASTMTSQYIQLANGSFAYTRREALGIVGAIGAWNFPFLTICWKLAPALACGNTMVYKPSPLSPLTTPILAEIVEEAGLPKGVFNVVQGGASTGQLISQHEGIAKMSFTGSVTTGSKIMIDSAPGIKNVTLELGGKSPLIVFEDADIENAVKGAMMANFLTQGEVCSNGTRVFVHETVKEKFLKQVVERTKNIKVGDPFHPDTKMGAMISEDQLNKVLNFVEGGKREGAKVLCGGHRIHFEDPNLADGYYMAPCVLDQCTDNMEVVREEIFGPVMSVLSFKTEEEVLRRANDTYFGLAGGLFTKDLTRAHRVMAKIQSGTVWVNNFNLYPPEIPFGGYKKSGIGRENGHAVLEHYSQTKTCYVEMGDVDCLL